MLGKSKVKYIQSLGQKKQRDEDGVFIAEGPKIVAELLAADNATVREVFALEEWIDRHNSEFGESIVHEVTEDELGKISQLSTPNQVVAVVSKFELPLIYTKYTVSLVLDGIQDPGNLGAIIRTSDWFGIRQIICSPDCADIYNPKVVQATMGSIARVNVHYNNLVEWLVSQKHTRIYGATLDGKDIGMIKKMTEGVIVIGNEARGISENVLEMLHERITIPGKGHAESLNAAVATGIILSHIT
jgi:RNA methyltransferase, TrmH family